MPSSYAALYYHLIWSTKERQPIILPEWEERLYAYIGGILRTEKNKLLLAGGTADHIHLLCSLGREQSIRDVVRTIKTNSSKWIRDSLLANFRWQDGYGAFSVSHTALPSAERYIRNQKAHHRKKTYEEEMREVFKMCAIEFDDRFFA